MNIGRNILELRKQKNITQEELSAELGVTAAAVSKWENGYTLPDILMLCALADFFEVTTDELLGRKHDIKYAVIATGLSDVEDAIKRLVESHGFIVKKIFPSMNDARESIYIDTSISHLFASFSKPLSTEEQDELPKGIRYIECHCDDKDSVLDGFELYFQNMSAYDALAKQSK